MPMLADNKNNKRGIAMNKKNALGILFLAGFLAMLLAGMVYLQPEKAQPQTAEYDLRGFPALPSERR
jgi:hypothetical protein